MGMRGATETPESRSHRQRHQSAYFGTSRYRAGTLKLRDLRGDEDLRWLRRRDGLSQWTAKGLREPQPRLLRPDAVLEIERAGDEPGAHMLLIEYDRTRRVDKNYGKFRRYDGFLNSWWQHTPCADLGEPPLVVFVCQDRQQREQFMAAADHELAGHRWHPSVDADRHQYVGRRRVLFALERDMHTAALEALRLPAFPHGHPSRTPDVRHVRLPRR